MMVLTDILIGILIGICIGGSHIIFFINWLKRNGYIVFDATDKLREYIRKAKNKG